MNILNDVTDKDDSSFGVDQTLDIRIKIKIYVVLFSDLLKFLGYLFNLLSQFRLKKQQRN